MEKLAVFIAKFEKQYRYVEKHHMKLLIGAKAYILLQAANLTIDNEQLARVTAKLDDDDMKNQVQKVFGDTVGNTDDTLPVKTEEFNYTTYRGQGGMRGRVDHLKEEKISISKETSHSIEGIKLKEMTRFH